MTIDLSGEFRVFPLAHVKGEVAHVGRRCRYEECEAAGDYGSIFDLHGDPVFKHARLGVGNQGRRRLTRGRRRSWLMSGGGAESDGC